MRCAAIVVLVGSACSFDHGTSATGTDALVTADDGNDSADAAPPDAIGSELCAKTYTQSEGSSLYRVGVADWYTAEAACEAEGAHLVVIGGVAENNFMLKLDPDGDIWVGMSDHVAEGTYRWLTGAAVAAGYTNWQLTQPNNAGLDEDCGEMNADGGWNDNGCQYLQTYVCECDGAALPAPPMWCRTATDTSCNTCSDDCTANGATCHSQQLCY
ncbi:MAG TPA: lectin-like protein [Kofleriaceae bacterium]